MAFIITPGYIVIYIQIEADIHKALKLYLETILTRHIIISTN